MSIVNVAEIYISKMCAEDIVKRYKELGYKGLCITDHVSVLQFSRHGGTYEEQVEKYLSGYRAAKKFEDENFHIILGMEIRFLENDNDYLVYGFDEDFIPTVYDWMDKTAQEFYDTFHSDDRLILQAHPGRNNMVEMDRSCVDGYEVFNLHPGHNSRVALAARLHQKNGGVAIGGTDFHHRGHEGCLFTCFAELPQDSKDLVRLLRSGDYIMMAADKVIFP